MSIRAEGHHGAVKHVSSGRGLSGANGCRFGPDGALYNASAFGSELARVDIDTGELTIVSPRGDGIVSPDDLAFDSAGILYVSECMDARVTAFQDGETWVVEDDIPGVNGIAIWEDRIFVDQFFPGGGLFEIFRDDRPRIRLAADLQGPNGCCVGPDGFIYFALVFPGEIRRIPVDGGAVELVAEHLAAPSSCRVGPDHAIYFSQGGSGQITRVDPATGELQTIYEGRPGIDNFDINADGRICISYYLDGAIYEVLSRTEARELVAPALLAPYGIAVADGAVQVADGFSAARLTFDGRLERAGKIADVIAEGLNHPQDLVVRAGRILLVEAGAGRVVSVDPEGGGVDVHRLRHAGRRRCRRSPQHAERAAERDPRTDVAVRRH